MRHDVPSSVGGGGGGGGSGGGAGSGGSTGTTTVTHCDINNAGTQTCIEYAVGYPDPAPGCAVLHGTFSTGGCDLTSSSGGCKQVFPSIGTMTTYFYLPTITADAVMVQCTNDGNAIYVAPP